MARGRHAHPAWQAVLAYADACGAPAMNAWAKTGIVERRGGRLVVSSRAQLEEICGETILRHTYRYKMKPR